MDKKTARNLVQEVLQNSFNKEKFTYLTKNLLNYIEEDYKKPYTGNYIFDDYKDSIKILDRVGKYKDPEGKLIDILIVRLKKETTLERARTKQRNFIAKYLKGSRGGVLKDAALAAFVSPNEDDWRFSLVKMEYKFNEKGKVEEEFTPARRYSFLVGKNENSHTAQSRLLPLLLNDEANPTLVELEETFSVEKVTKEFFEKYRDLFLRLKESLDVVVKKDTKVAEDFKKKNINAVDFAKKLLGQIVFLYFLQKKGWFGVPRGKDWGEGDKKFLRTLFDKAQKEKKNYCNRFLEPLFYEALRLERPKDYYDQFNCRIPFLNGGLFDPINEYDWQDTDIEIPNDIFSNNRKTKEGDIGDGILDVFDRYNFTVKEDEPLEKEVAIDPEMLGKVFENLLEVKDRKSKGTYYTPREIVHYMCQESLANYLATDLKGKVKKEEIDTLIKYGESVVEHDSRVINKGRETDRYSFKLPENIRKYAKLIDEKLATIRVCDPAVGSGAFPVGMMNEVIRTRNALTPYIKCITGIFACEESSISLSDNNIHITRRNLPHWTKAGSIYWITFRLADSLPKEKLYAWKSERDLWLSKHPQPWSDSEWREYNKRFGDQLEKWLDSGHGSCALARPEVRQILQGSLLRFNGERLLLHAGVIMPNHVHLLLEPLKKHSLSKLLKGIKGASARSINHLLGKTGTALWMDESYDHIVRSEAQYQHFLRYVIENPAKARLSDNQYWLYQDNTQTRMSVPQENTQTRMSVPQENTQTRMSVPRSSYHFKRHAIQNCLYGVDIDPGAVEIAKLRLWLSLIIDEEDREKIQPLPNLDYKIVQGNSLLSVEKDLFNADLFNKLEKLKPLYFNETSASKKQEYRKQIDELISQITRGHKDFDFEVYFSEVFHEKGGFDVVIANPPYVRADSPDIKEQRQLILQSKNYQTLYERWDLYIAFIERGFQILGAGGVLEYIIPDAYMSSKYAIKSHDYFLKNATISRLNFLNDIKVFEAAVKNIIIEYKKEPNPQNTPLKIQHSPTFNDFLKLPSASQEKMGELTFRLESDDKILGELENTLQWGEICYVSYGLRPSSDERYWPGEFKKDDLISDQKDRTHPKAYTEGKWIKKYAIEQIKYLEWGTDRSPKKIVRSTFPELYEPPKIMMGGMTGAIYNISGLLCNHSITVSVLWKDLRGVNNKSISGSIKKDFKIKDAPAFRAELEKKSENFGLKYLLSVLNSKLGNYYLSKVRRSQIGFYPDDLKKLPIKKIAKDEQKPFIDLVDKILAITQGDTGILACEKNTDKNVCATACLSEDARRQVRECEKQIDQMVYELYGLTDDEIAIVEGKK